MASGTTIDINKALYARDAETIKKLAMEVETQNNNLLKFFSKSNEYYANIIKTIDANWVGADADKYKKIIDNDIQSLKAAANKARNEILTTLNQVLQEFLSFQDKN